MSFLVNASEEAIVSGQAYQTYMAHIASIRNRLPPAVYDFATAIWHYDSQDPKCPHDAWIQEIKIREIAEGDTHQIRKTEIEVIMLGAYHDRLQKVTYKNVNSYSWISPHSENGHGDWLIDEIGMSELGSVTHELKFSEGARLKVECAEILFEEQLTTAPFTATWQSTH